MDRPSTPSHSRSQGTVGRSGAGTSSSARTAIGVLGGSAAAVIRSSAPSWRTRQSRSPAPMRHATSVGGAGSRTLSRARSISIGHPAGSRLQTKADPEAPSATHDPEPEASDRGASAPSTA